MHSLLTFFFCWCLTLETRGDVATWHRHWIWDQDGVGLKPCFEAGSNSLLLSASQ